MLRNGWHCFNEYVPSLGMAVLLFVLFRKRQYRSFPFFTLLIAQELLLALLADAVTLVMPHSAGTFYRATGVLDEVIQVFVFYELAKHIFCPTGVWAKDIRKTFLGMMALCFVIAFALMAADHPPSATPTALFVLRSYFASAVLMSELFVMAVFLSAAMGLPWNTHVARIAQGLGLYSVVCVVFDLIISYTGLLHYWSLYLTMWQIRHTIWVGCEIYWIVALWQDAPEPRELPEQMRTQIYALNQRLEYDLGRIRLWKSS